MCSNAFSLDLYYLAFLDDRQFAKYLIYGIYAIEFVQTMLTAHNVFATFGYGFGDMDALNKMNFNWLTVPIMSAVGVQNICCQFAITYHDISCLCWASLLCIPNLHSVKVTNHPDTCHLCSLLCSFPVAILVICLQVSLTSSVAAVFSGIYTIQTGNATRMDNRKTQIAAGVCHLLVLPSLSC